MKFIRNLALHFQALLLSKNFFENNKKNFKKIYEIRKNVSMLAQEESKYFENVTIYGKC